MGETEFQLAQLVTLAIGTPEVGAVNFNLLHKVLLEILKMTDLDNATVRFTSSEAAKLEDALRHAIKPALSDVEGPGNIVQAEEETTGSTSLRKSPFVHQCLVDPSKIDRLLQDVDQLKFDFEDLTSKFTTIVESTETVPFQDMRNSLNQIDGVQERVTNIEAILENVKNLAETDDNMPLSDRLRGLERHVEVHADQLERINDVLDHKLNLVLEQYSDVERNIDVLHEKLDIATSSTHLLKQSIGRDTTRLSVVQEQQSSMNTVISRLSSIQHELELLEAVVSNLREEQKEKQSVMDAIVDELEELKSTKADKANMEDILAAKADVSQVHRKVSHDHHESSLQEVVAQLQEAFSRLEAHEELWKEEVEDLKADVQRRIDKVELSPLKDYVNDKLKTFQERIKNLTVERRVGEAAGTKRKLIRDVQCISCDNESVMKPRHSLEDAVPPPSLPPQQSVKPYLSYQLDRVRRHQTQPPPGRSPPHHKDVAPKPSGPKSSRQSSQSASSNEHLVHRYVGGSHTTTTADQRVARPGYFHTWGPLITATSPLPSTA